MTEDGTGVIDAGSSARGGKKGGLTTKEGKKEAAWKNGGTHLIGQEVEILWSSADGKGTGTWYDLRQREERREKRIVQIPYMLPYMLSYMCYVLCVFFAETYKH